MEKLVSIITPTYGRAQLLKDTVKSVLAQTYHNIEYIVVDDNGKGSPNQIATQNVLAAVEDKRFKYLPLEKNQGGSHARNVGAFASSGDYICFLDDDDLFEPTKIEEQVKLMEEHGEYVGCYCNHVRKNHITGIITGYTSGKRGNILKEVLLFNVDVCSGSTLMIRRNVFEQLNGFTEGLRRFQDYEFLTRLCAEGDMGLVDSCLVVINTHEGSNRNRQFRKDEEDRMKYLEAIAPVTAKLDKHDLESVIFANNSYLFTSAVKLHSVFGILKYLLRMGLSIRTFHFLLSKIKKVLNS